MSMRRLLVPMAMLCVALGNARAQATPVGRWRTVSDVDGKPAAIIEVIERDGTLQGVVRSLLDSSATADERCEHCEGERHNQPIVGMTILWNMRRDGDEWRGGAILAPDSGHIYKATLRLASDGAQLIVHGYIGISLFGRSQTWYREGSPAVAPRSP